MARAIDSALAQEGVRVEVIVIDDGSTDASLDVIRGYDGRIRWETGPNRGACAARNRGLALSRAPSIMFLDADDYIEGPFLASGLSAMRDVKAQLGFGALASERNGSRKTFSLPKVSAAPEVAAALFEKGFIPPCSTVWSRSFIEEIGGWKDDLRRFQDLEVVLRALSRRPVVATWKGGVGVWYQHEGPLRISSRNDPETLRDQLDVLKKIYDCLVSAGMSEVGAMDINKRAFYDLCRMAARYESPDFFKLVIDQYKKFGSISHYGSSSHILACRLIGLRRKERLALKLHAAFSRFRRMRA